MQPFDIVHILWFGAYFIGIDGKMKHVGLYSGLIERLGYVRNLPVYPFAYDVNVDTTREIVEGFGFEDMSGGTSKERDAVMSKL